MALSHLTTLDSVSSGATEESSLDLLNDRLNLMAATTVIGVAYGVMISLYATCVFFLIKNLRTKSGAEWRKSLFYIIYASTLFVLATLYTAGNSENAIVAYVDNRLFSGGPYVYYLEYMWNQPVMIMTDASYFLIFWLTDVLILWRFIIFYRSMRYSKWIIPLPCFMYLCVIGSWTDTPYAHLVAIVSESAILYGLWSFVFLILCIEGSPGQVIILTSISQVQVIAPLLIILRIARGTAWGSENRSDSPARTAQPSRLSFNSRAAVRALAPDEFGVGGHTPSTYSSARSVFARENDIELGFASVTGHSDKDKEIYNVEGAEGEAGR
ncbi:hypothetical protein F5I97DRAFT_1816674 [Phlebopus sp. FC_14]|nr:hypothetical protein F5I97DRAFT_1816674 [Phlebopus sp. FC_14]